VIVARHDDATVTPRGPRGRVAIVGGTLVTDKGTRLRGVTVAPDVGQDFGLDEDPERARATVRRLFDALTLESGLNAVHVYLENQTVAVGSRQEIGDLLVDEAERAGLYVIVGLGSGMDLGEFDQEHAEAFWNLYAPQYAERTHVLFELHNAPERTCVPWADASIALENDLFDVVRSHAPDTHVVAFSYIGTPTDDTLNSGIEATTINWTNASIGFHANADCRPIGEIATFPPTPPGDTVAFFATEIQPNDDDGHPTTVALETAEIGWASFRWLTSNQNMSTFRTEHEAIDWCPDFGTWPMDSKTCSE
jgi:hypothetical protein